MTNKQILKIKYHDKKRIYIMSEMIQEDNFGHWYVVDERLEDIFKYFKFIIKKNVANTPKKKIVVVNRAIGYVRYKNLKEEDIDNNGNKIEARDSGHINIIIEDDEINDINTEMKKDKVKKALKDKEIEKTTKEIEEEL